MIQRIAILNLPFNISIVSNETVDTEENTPSENNLNVGKEDLLMNKDNLLPENKAIVGEKENTPSENNLNVGKEASLIDEDNILPENEAIVGEKENTSEKTRTNDQIELQNFKEELVFDENYIPDILPDEQTPFDPWIYLSHLAQMFNNKRQYMIDMVEILLQQIPETSQKMEVAIAAENWEEVFSQSHRIKSTFKIAGLQPLVNVCLAIEGRTRIIAPAELHLVPGFFKQFQELAQAEIPNLQASLEYLKAHEEDRISTKKTTENTDGSDFILLL